MAIQRKCPVCGKSYNVFPSDVARSRRKTCSRTCKKKLLRELFPRPKCPNCQSIQTYLYGMIGNSIRYKCGDCGTTYY